EWARKLMPGHPDPRVNLALTLERAGRVDDAAEAYGAALEVHPGHMPATQGLARLEVRYGRAGAGSAERLRAIALGGTSAAWREWAQGRMTRLDGGGESDAAR
ncbi:MAG: tetratricopeptide repeat protein, partial [Phycisphaerales bacterium]|nr:tetratricopeptide repeat protein [Phycisphaerales bacterium]